MKSKLSVALVLIIISVVLFSACRNNDISSPVDAVTTTANDIVIPQKIDLFAENAEYRIVRADNADGIIKDAIIDFRNTIDEKFGVSLLIENDYETPDFDVSQRYKYEILIGLTNRTESLEVIDSLKYNDFLITVKGTKIVIIGGNDNATLNALQLFKDTYLTSDVLNITDAVNHTYKGSYENENLTLGGVDISEYRIVYGNKHKALATTVAQRIGEYTGARIVTARDSSEETEREIVIGSVKRTKPPAFGTEGFCINPNGTGIYINAVDESALSAACGVFLNILESGQPDITNEQLAIEYSLPERSVYINDIDKLAIVWAPYFKVPESMLDFDTKYAEMKNPRGRLMSCLHRGDTTYYPENSVECLISAIKMGADMIETDPRRTKDNILVLFHDDTLNRMTNYSELCGKNGLPTSPLIKDWTYEQLMQLNLKAGLGGDTADITPYKIATLEEAIRVCANRIFIRLDVKTDENNDIFWSYEQDIWPLQIKYKTYTNVIFTWHSFFSGNYFSTVRLFKQKQIEACGNSGIFFIGTGNDDPASFTISNITAYGLDPCVRLTEFNLAAIGHKEYLEKYEKKLSVLRASTRIYVDGQGAHESVEVWSALYDGGISLIMVNHGYELCQYIALSENNTERGD